MTEEEVREVRVIRTAATEGSLWCGETREYVAGGNGGIGDSKRDRRGRIADERVDMGHGSETWQMPANTPHGHGKKARYARIGA
jgi:hypothetical protein